MTEENAGGARDFIELTGEIVAAYVSSNSIPVSDLPSLIRSVHDAIAMVTSGSASTNADTREAVDKPGPTQIRKSVQRDGIVSFIDGKAYKTLKRHLTANGFSPQSYRERYDLPSDYPMVAPSYAEHRSALAKAIGLGVPGARADQRRTGTGV
ncbi:MucR family transcriptional regulator [Methylobacterium pseudosasicola]|uniref:Transcriptional regulator, MucR family n=1 Tax=Methylobacterium pseudosasicola TaxID=582667 RepID=A0A1I4SA18_9HYPH|nr:MucR family transcriptional regulator [Methylobacterium pseudosasicola]SFM61356.1 transcriptional regulator, MucR family [Methylobacterium pseudosasicola]